MALLRWYGSPGCFDSGLQLICIVGSGVSHLSLDMQNLLSSEKRTLDHRVIFLHSPGKTLLTLSLVQKWLGSPFSEDV